MIAQSRKMRRCSYLKVRLNRLGSMFKKEPLNCDYVYEILGDIIGFFNCDKHITALIQDQERINNHVGAWSESFKFRQGEEAPQTTAEAIMALLPYIDRTEVKEAIRRACQYLVVSQNADGGWKDMIGYSVCDATGCAIAALSEAKKKNIDDIPRDLFKKAIDFLISQQNEDGGWCTVKGQNSKMHYTFFALWGLENSKDFLHDGSQIKGVIDKGVDWILNNSSSHGDEGLSLSLNDAPSPVATTLAILCFLNINQKARVKKQWLEFLRKNENNGSWSTNPDTSVVKDERRTYEFQVIPWIVESFVRTGEKLDTKIVKNSLRRLKDYEHPRGGFVKNPGDTIPVVWQTSWSLVMMHYLKQELLNNLRYYVDSNIKSSMDLSRKVENYERELSPEKTLMVLFGVFTAAFVAAATCLLYVLTNEIYGKLLWFPFYVVLSATITMLVAFYWRKRQRLDDLRILLLGTIWTAITLIIAII